MNKTLYITEKKYTKLKQAELFSRYSQRYNKKFNEECKIEIISSNWTTSHINNLIRSNRIFSIKCSSQDDMDQLYKIVDNMNLRFKNEKILEDLKQFKTIKIFVIKNRLIDYGNQDSDRYVNMSDVRKNDLSIQLAIRYRFTMEQLLILCNDIQIELEDCSYHNLLHILNSQFSDNRFIENIITYIMTLSIFLQPDSKRHLILKLINHNLEMVCVNDDTQLIKTDYFNLYANYSYLLQNYCYDIDNCLGCNYKDKIKEFRVKASSDSVFIIYPQKQTIIPLFKTNTITYLLCDQDVKNKDIDDVIFLYRTEFDKYFTYLKKYGYVENKISNKNDLLKQLFILLKFNKSINQICVMRMTRNEKLNVLNLNADSSGIDGLIFMNQLNDVIDDYFNKEM